MADIKQATFRLNDDDIVKFREIADAQGMNQADMFQGLLNAFEMAKAKNQITDRGKEIDTFQATVNTLVSMFVNSLAINQTSEERIRETLSLELNTKDNTIKDLQEEKQKLKEEAAALKESLDTKTKIAKVAENELDKLSKETETLTDKLNKDISEKADTINSLQSQLQTLNGIIDEYKSYKANYNSLEETIKDLNRTTDELTTSNKDITLKLENESKMKDFYEKQVNELKGSIEQLNKDNKELELAHRKEVETLETNHKQELHAIEVKYQDIMDKEVNNISGNFEDKLQLEKEKLEFTISKNNVDLENTKTKFNDLKEKYDSLVKESQKKETAHKGAKKKKDIEES